MTRIRIYSFQNRVSRDVDAFAVLLHKNNLLSCDFKTTENTVVICFETKQSSRTTESLNSVAVLIIQGYKEAECLIAICKCDNSNESSWAILPNNSTDILQEK